MTDAFAEQQKDAQFKEDIQLVKTLAYHSIKGHINYKPSHSRVGGNPVSLYEIMKGLSLVMDSRLRGNDEWIGIPKNLYTAYSVL